jgi:alpha-mannosidase
MGIGTGEGGEVAGSWRGAYTSQARSKKANRDMENLLITAEKFATIGSMLQRKPLFPRVDFREIWKIVLKNQFHDILPGTSIGDVFDDAMADYLYVKDEGERLLSFGLEVIGSRIDTRGEGISLIVYNPLSWPRTDVVTAAVRFVVGPEEIGLVDKNGDSVLFQVDGWAEDGRTAYISFLARDVPGIGYEMYRVLEKQSDSPSSDLMFGPDFVVNDFFKIRYDNEGIEGIYDKKGGRELLDDTGNVLQLLEEGRSSSWDLTPTGRKIDLENFSGPEVIEDGPVRIVIAWQDRSEDSFFTRELILKAGVPRLTFRMTVDWHDHDKILKVGFPTAVEDGSGYFEQPYGYIERSVDGTEWPAQNWIDLSGEEYGVALLNNGKYGFDILENTMQMSVVRGARDMDPRMDEGMHSFDYALYPHEGDWRDGDVTRQALELNQPMIAVQEGHHSGDLPDWARKNDFSLPPSHTFFSTNSDHVILSAVKVQQGDWSPQNIVLRLYETEGRSGEVRVTLPTEPKTVVETDFLESPIEPVSPLKVEGNSMVFEIGHDQIRTFLVAF